MAPNKERNIESAFGSLQLPIKRRRTLLVCYIENSEDNRL